MTNLTFADLRILVQNPLAHIQAAPQRLLIYLHCGKVRHVTPVEAMVETGVLSVKIDNAQSRVSEDCIF